MLHLNQTYSSSALSPLWLYHQLQFSLGTCRAVKRCTKENSAEVPYRPFLIKDFHSAAKSFFLIHLPWTQVFKLIPQRALARNLYCKQKYQTFHSSVVGYSYLSNFAPASLFPFPTTLVVTSKSNKWGIITGRWVTQQSPGKSDAFLNCFPHGLHSANQCHDCHW